jgi:uncharacterized protein (DUF362 family)
MRLRGEVLDEWPVSRPSSNADKVINVPVAKHHNLARYTGAMKNWYGSLGGRRNRLHQNIDRVHRRSRHLHAADAHGASTRCACSCATVPQGGNVADAKETRT